MRLAALLVGAVLAAAVPGGAGAQPARAETLAGETVFLAGRRAPTVMLLWSPDSLASKKSIGELQRFHAVFAARGVRTLAVSTLRDAARLRAYAAEQRLEFPVLMLADPAPEHALPLLYVFDSEGRLHATRPGLFRLRDLERLVEPLLPDPQSK